MPSKNGQRNRQIIIFHTITMKMQLNAMSEGRVQKRPPWWKSSLENNNKTLTLSLRRLSGSLVAPHVGEVRRSVAQWVRRSACSWPGELYINVGG